MCLHRIDNTVKALIKKEGSHSVGYKIFIKSHKKLYFQFYDNKRPTTGKWIKSKDFEADDVCQTLLTDHMEQYPIGFHFYLNLEEAISAVKSSYVVHKMTVRKIYFRKPVAFGTQNKKGVGVAEEIFIHRGEVK